ncbi:hypothetical protein [Klebsiella oxytoca]|uniref:hypothetical protein n=1 Tax=Klebsiella oxytoca TaxID=571 RepID=UPI00190ED51D|nr:hypothetical protein [Klebsiella oxytoca]
MKQQPAKCAVDEWGNLVNAEDFRSPSFWKLYCFHCKSPVVLYWFLPRTGRYRIFCMMKPLWHQQISLHARTWNVPNRSNPRQKQKTTYLACLTPFKKPTLTYIFERETDE